MINKYFVTELSTRTLQQRLHDMGLRRRNVSYDIHEIRWEIIKNLNGPRCSGGYRSHWHTLRSKGIQVPRRGAASYARENNGNQGPVSRKPGNFSGPQNHSKISNIAITELFYSHILKMNWVSLHTRSFIRILSFVFRYRWSENGFTGPKSFRGFRETGPWPQSYPLTYLCTKKTFVYWEILIRALAIYIPVFLHWKYICALKNIFVHWEIYQFVHWKIYLCSGKYICALKNIFVHWEIYLYTEKYICALGNIFVH